MNKFLLIFVVHAIIAVMPRSMAKVNNDNLIDFWTNSYNEIILHFRYNKNTHELEMQQSDVNEENKECAKRTKGKDLGKSAPPINKKSKEKPKDIKAKVDETPKDRFLVGVNLQSISPGLKLDVLKIKPKVTSPAPVSSTTERLDEVKIIEAEKEEKEIEKTTSTEEAIRTTVSTTVNPLSIEACSLNCSQEPHIACGNSWTFADNCSPSTTILNLDNYQELLLRLHNDNRNNLAGNLTQFEPATHMATVQWNSELAEYALLNALKCDMEHDGCHNTKEFQRTGQNLAWKSWTNRRTSIESILEQMVYDWYREDQYARQSDLDSYQGNGLDNEVISHFTAIVNERNTHMGCGATQAKEGRKISLFLACNYARNNIFDAPIYVKGPTASQCQTGINPDYSNLCSIDELYDYNN